MFNFLKNGEAVKLEGKIESLQEDRLKLKEEVEDLKLKKKIEDEDIKHMVKIEKERLELEHDKKSLKLEREKEKEIATVKDEYRDKVEKQLEAQKEDIKGMYGEILKRLPDINVKLKGEIG